ncbi:MAG: hypothetical protein EBR82_39805 [Caulobacteraceae bacterium]|jgi:hypothetical protein|nr:hypothetical protein [Caulobacteraceae bacterium]
MTISVEIPVLLGGVVVHTSDNRGFTPEELTERAIEKIIYVGSNSHPAVRAQAEAFKESIKGVVLAYMKEAVACHNVTIANKLTQAGHPELVKLLD